MNAFTTWLIHSAAGAALLLLATAALMCLTAQPARRQRLGELGVLAALLLSALCLLPSWLHIPLPAPTAVPDAAAEAPELVEAPFFFEEMVLEDVGAPVDVEAPPAATTFPLPHFGTILPLFFIACAGLFAARWLVGFIGLSWLLHRSAAAPASVRALIDDFAPALRGVRLLVSPRLQGPISCGLFRPTIVLPASLCLSDAARLRWIITHELTHLRRFDPWSCLLLAVGQALFFYLPWFCWVRRQVRLCQEYVADAAAIAAAGSGPAADYAEFLLSLTRAPAVPLGATGVSGHRSDLYRRLSMLLQNPLRVEQSCPRSWLLFTGAAFLGAAVMLAGLGVASSAVDAGAPQAVERTKPVPPVPPVPPAAVKPAEPRKDAVADPAAQIRDALRELEKQPSAEELRTIRERIQEAAKQLRAAKELDGVNIEVEIKPFNLPQEAAAQLRAAQELAQARIRAVQPNLEIRRFPLERGRLGLAVDRPSDILADQLDLPKGTGLVVIDVVGESPAAKAGIKVNDLLLEMNKQPVKSDPGDFARQVGEVKGDAAIELTLLRKGKKMTLKDIKLPEAPKADVIRPPFPAMGLFRGGPGMVMSTVMRNKDGFTTHHHEGKLMIRVTGKIEGGKAMVERILIQDGRPPQSYDKVEDVPEQYRNRVNQAIELSRNAAAMPTEEKK